MLVDPTGLGPETWEVQANGRTKKVDNTQYYQEGDNVVAVPDHCAQNYTGGGTPVDKVQSAKDPEKYIYTKKQTMDSKGNQEGQDMYHPESESEAKKFFEFMSIVTDVEWDNTNYRDKWTSKEESKNMVSTIGEEDHSAGLGYLDKIGMIINFSHHSHPGYSRVHSGDGDAIRDLSIKNQDASYKVYYPGTGYKDYDKWTR